MTQADSKFYYPTCAQEWNLESSLDREKIGTNDIADWAYPPGERKRYTRGGWAKAKRIGIAILRVEGFGAKP